MEKTPNKGLREKKEKDWNPNKRPHLKMQNAQWEAQGMGENELVSTSAPI
jgi:hypothetical protein